MHVILHSDSRILASFSFGGGMLSLKELQRAARIIRKEFAGATLRRIVQPAADALVLTFEGSAGKAHLLLSIEPKLARISLTEPGDAASSDSSFCQYARARLVKCSLSGIQPAENDRQVSFHLQSRAGQYELIFSIMGVRSNIYLLDSGRLVLHSMRPLDETRRNLCIGETWKDPDGAAPSIGVDRWEDVADSGYLEAIEATYCRLEQKHKAELLGLRIQQAVRKEQSFLERKAINLQEDLGEARQAESYRKKGELLKTVLHTIKPGDDRVTATDYQTAETFEIPLDPQLSPVENLESYFARYQKDTRGAKVIQRQLEELNTIQSELDRIERRLQEALKDALSNVKILEDIASQPGVRRLMARYGPKRKPRISAIKPSAKKEIPARLLPKRYRTEDGLEIWVGKNDEGNDYLSTRLARGNDLFFHLDGYPGSHVVLRTEGRPDPPSKSILDACELAVHFSKMKNAGNADVHMAAIKNVKKPKGAKPGLVYVRGGKSIHLRHDPKRLQNILASRIE